MNIKLFTAIAALCFLLPLTSNNLFAQQVTGEVSGTWSFYVDNVVDGKVSGTNGCPTVILDKCGPYVTGAFGNCTGANSVTSGSPLEGKLTRSNRGLLLQLIHANQRTAYLASWSGHVVDDNTIRGVFVDISGKSFEFKMIRQ